MSSTTLPPYLKFHQYIEDGLYKVKVICNSTSQGVYETVKNIQFKFLPSLTQLTFQEVVFSYPANGVYTKTDEIFNITLNSSYAGKDIQICDLIYSFNSKTNYVDIINTTKELIVIKNYDNEDIALAITEKVKLIDFHKYLKVDISQVVQDISFNIWVTEPSGISNGFSYIFHYNSAYIEYDSTYSILTSKTIDLSYHDTVTPPSGYTHSIQFTHSPNESITINQLNTQILSMTVVDKNISLQVSAYKFELEYQEIDKSVVSETYYNDFEYKPLVEIAFNPICI